MSAALPDVVDAWRMVSSQRRFQGSLPLRDMRRLRDSLASDAGEAHYDLEFGRDAVGVAYLAVRVEARLPLTCQRSLETFALPVSVSTQLGLIAHERDEAALPPGFEALLVQDNELHLREVVEDELILALPVVPVKPGLDPDSKFVYETAPEGEDEEPAAPNPFDALAKFRKH
jgi:uncharacterized protein